MTIILIDCLDCKHFQGAGRCAAFPDGIPEKYLKGAIHHAPDGTEVGGLIWEAADPTKDQSRRDARIARQVQRSQGRRGDG